MNTGGQATKKLPENIQETEEQPNQLNDGSAVLIQALKDQDVEIIFGYPGGAVLPIYDALYKNPITQKVNFEFKIYIDYLIDYNNI